MKSLDWHSILGQHPVFGALSEEQINRLLDDRAADERDCPENHVILREGESGNSVFLIGSGSVWIVLRDDEGHNIPLSSLEKGEFFGELAVLEQRPRSATVIAKERCLLLEIKGKTFLDVVHGHPDIEFKVLLKLCERLRHVSEDILSVRLKDVDERFRRFNTKLDAELKVIDASLKATQTVFDQTSKRANEIIESADRSRTRLTTAASAIGIVITTIVAVFGFIGFSELRNIKDDREEIQRQVEEAKEYGEEIKQTARVLDTVDEEISRFRDLRLQFYTQIMVPRFREEMEKEGGGRSRPA